MAFVMPGQAVRRRSPWPLVGAVAAGAAVAVFLGAYADRHTPAGQPTLSFGFPTMLDSKAWLTTAAALLALVQLGSGLRLRDVISWPRTVPLWLGDAHRLSGTLAVVCTLPVAYHCLWSLGFRFSAGGSAEVRVLAHAVAGCVFYGAFVTKMLAVRIDAVPRRAVPVAGGLVFAALVAVWLTSAAWFFAGQMGG